MIFTNLRRSQSLPALNSLAFDAAAGLNGRPTKLSDSTSATNALSRRREPFLRGLSSSLSSLVGRITYGLRSCNAQISNTKDFLQKNFLTAVRHPGKASGLNVFEFNPHKQGDLNVVTLDAPGTHSCDKPLMGHWAPQGGFCDIPKDPGAASYVFTPDFSGCSILVDQLSADQYRVYHVQGGSNYLQKEYLDQPQGHGLGLAAAMTFDDYGDKEHPRGFAFLKHEEGRWWIYFQRQDGIGLNFGSDGFRAMGAQEVLGGGRIPVADLQSERPQPGASHTGHLLPFAQGIGEPQDTLKKEIW